jgi:hypothetical protein
MNETIKLIRFSGMWIVSQVEEIPETEFGDPDCVLKYPYEVEGTCLGVFPQHSRDREFIVRSSEISLIADPSDFLYKQYTELASQERAALIDEYQEIIDQQNSIDPEYFEE